MMRTVYLVLWRKFDGETWHEIGAVPTLEAAEAVAQELAEATGLQTSQIEWRNSPFAVV